MWLLPRRGKCRERPPNPSGFDEIEDWWSSPLWWLFPKGNRRTLGHNRRLRDENGSRNDAKTQYPTDIEKCWKSRSVWNRLVLGFWATWKVGNWPKISVWGVINLRLKMVEIEGGLWIFGKQYLRYWGGGFGLPPFFFFYFLFLIWSFGPNYLLKRPIFSIDFLTFDKSKVLPKKCRNFAD